MLFEITDGEPLVGVGLKKDAVRDMVQTYRKKHKLDDSLHFAHFTVKEIMTLFVQNQILPKEVLDLIIDTSPNKEKYGVKIYLGTHINRSSFGETSRYRYFDTTIICNTIIEKPNFYADMLDNKANNDQSLYVSLPVAYSDEIGSGDGLDKANICPPDCPEPITDDKYDIGYGG